MNKRVNKKVVNSTKGNRASTRGYTTTSEVKELKETLRSYQQQSKELVKLIKHFKGDLRFYENLREISNVKIIKLTIKHLEYFLQVYQDGIKMTSYEIQLKRQQVFESLCNYHPDKEVAKKRLMQVK